MEAPLIVALLVIAGAWAAFLLPEVFGSRRDAPLNSTADFNRWTNVMADVQRRPFNSGVAVAREIVRARRRRTLVVLTLVALGTLVLALSRQSLNWLLGHIAVDAVIAWYLAMLIQIRQQHIQRVVGSVAEDRRFDREESKVRIVAN
jgi:hypothetical protein